MVYQESTKTASGLPRINKSRSVLDILLNIQGKKALHPHGFGAEVESNVKARKLVCAAVCNVHTLNSL